MAPIVCLLVHGHQLAMPWLGFLSFGFFASLSLQDQFVNLVLELAIVDKHLIVRRPVLL